MIATNELLKSKRDDATISMFMPSLLTLLQQAEHAKGEALSKDEVLKVRDEAMCVALSKEDAATLENKRGYRDVDPDNVWKEWEFRRLDDVQRDEAPAAD